MKFLLLFTLLSSVATLIDDKEWNLFKKTFNKTYENYDVELYRHSIWRNASRIVEEHNKKFSFGQTTYSLGLNQDSDLTEEELLSFKTGFKMSSFEMKRAKYAKLRNTLNNNITEYLPTFLDWRAYGLVTSVKYQGYCGACWAFAAAGALEGRFLKKMNITARNFDASLSSEYFLDCDNSNWGCSGGDFAQSLRFSTNSGTVLDRKYPYTGTKSSCDMDKISIVYKPKTYNMIYSEKELQSALVKQGPIAITMYCNTNSFTYYKGGIYDDYDYCYKNYQGNHAMLAVGYGSENGVEYWIIKNTWGVSWGEKGYIRVRKGYHTCGIGRYGGYPVD